MRKVLNRLTLVALLLFTLSTPVGAQFTAQIQLALQTLGIWPYDGSYSDGEVPIYVAALNKFEAGTPTGTVTGGTCTNQAVTAINTSGIPTCTTLTSTYVNTSIWTGTAASGLLKASSQGVVAQAVAGTDYLAPTGSIAGLTGTLSNAVQDNITRTGTLVSGATGTGYTVNLNASTVTNAASSWTPAITFGGGSTGLTYTSRAGHYWRMGKLVCVQGHVNMSAKGSSTGAALMGGLPVAVENSTSSNTPFAVWGAHLAAGVLSLSALAGVNSTDISLYSFTAGEPTQLTDAEFANNTIFAISGCYPSV